MYFVFSVEEYFEEVGNANPTMEASFESVCDSVSRKAGRKLACGLVKNKKPFFTGPTGSTTRLFFSLFKCRLHTYSDKPEASQRVYKRPYRAY